MIDWNGYPLNKLAQIPRHYDSERDIPEVEISWADLRLYMGLMVALSNIESLEKKIEKMEDEISELKNKLDDSHERDYQ